MGSGIIWLGIVGVFLLSAFMTYGFLANLEDARREKEKAEGPDVKPAKPDERKHVVELPERQPAESDAGWYQRTRVPYGHCGSAESCDLTTRCVQCAFFETTEEDIPALRKLWLREAELAELAHKRDLQREAEIHRRIAVGIQKHVEQFEALGEGKVSSK